MCGIAGYIGSAPPDDSRIRAALGRMRNRGPDVQNFARLDSGHVTLLHSRLSILDLDPRSNQPFSEGGCTLVFNGEIYNYVELRSALEKQGHAFNTASDT